jgi:hypothetical protein
MLDQIFIADGPCSSQNKKPFLNHILVILLFRSDVNWDSWLYTEYKVTYLSHNNL